MTHNSQKALAIAQHQHQCNFSDPFVKTLCILLMPVRVMLGLQDEPTLTIEVFSSGGHNVISIDMKSIVTK